MTRYLQDNDPVDIYTMMKDMESDLSDESKTKLYTIFLKGYKQPFVDLFKENLTKLRPDHTAEEIAFALFYSDCPLHQPRHATLSIRFDRKYCRFIFTWN